MLITLTPIRSDDRLALSRRGDVLTINGQDYDFGPLSEGATLPREAVDCPALASDVTREGGQLRLALILPHGAEAGEDARFPAPLVLTADGPVSLPETHPEPEVPNVED
jgi:hypothetical protein